MRHEVKGSVTSICYLDVIEKEVQNYFSHVITQPSDQADYAVDTLKIFCLQFYQKGVRQCSLQSIQVGSNQLPFTAWNQEGRHRDRDKTNLFTKASGGFVIVVSNNYLNDSKIHSLEPTQLTLTGKRQGTFHQLYFLNQTLSADFLPKISKLFWR